MSKEETVTGEIGLGSHVQIDGRGEDFFAGLEARRVNGLTGVVVRTDEGHPEQEFTVRLDDQSGRYGWRGTGRNGDPDDRDAFCYHVPGEYLVLVSGGVEPEPETTDVKEFKQKIYTKAMDLCRDSYGGWEDRVTGWLRDLNMAPRSTTFRISGELSGAHGYRTVEHVQRTRVRDLPGVTVEATDLTWPRRRPGETVESLTADIFALVDRVCREEGVCGDAWVFVRRLGLRPPPRREVEVKVSLNLNSVELAQLTRNGPAALLELVREARSGTGRIGTVQVLDSDTKPAAEAEPEPDEDF